MNNEPKPSAHTPVGNERHFAFVISFWLLFPEEGAIMIQALVVTMNRTGRSGPLLQIDCHAGDTPAIARIAGSATKKCFAIHDTGGIAVFAAFIE